jgi:hypothetical protein
MLEYAESVWLADLLLCIVAFLLLFMALLMPHESCVAIKVLVCG